MTKFPYGLHNLAALVVLLSSGAGCGSDDAKPSTNAGAVVDSEDAGPAADSGMRAQPGESSGSKPATSKGSNGTAPGSAASAKSDGNGAGGKGGSAASATNSAAGAAADANTLSRFEKLASAYCGKLSECAAFGFGRNYVDADECRKRRLSLYEFWAASPDTGWTPDSIDGCAKVISGIGCRDFVDEKGLQACAPKGKRKPGEQCNTREQCETRFCDAAGYGCGVCGNAPAAGASCAEDNDCPDEHACLCNDGTPRCNNRRCLRLRDADEECSAQAPCGSGLNCLQGRCKAAQNMEGAACNPIDGVECDTVSSGLVCGEKGCTKLKPADVCSPTEYCKDSRTTCEVSDDGMSAKCAPLPEDNGSCDVVKGRLCRFPALCASGTCQLPGAGPLCPSPKK
jgi:hypothetical protein